MSHSVTKPNLTQVDVVVTLRRVGDWCVRAIAQHPRLDIAIRALNAPAHEAIALAPQRTMPLCDPTVRGQSHSRKLKKTLHLDHLDAMPESAQCRRAISAGLQLGYRACNSPVQPQAYPPSRRNLDLDTRQTVDLVQDSSNLRYASVPDPLAHGATLPNTVCKLPPFSCRNEMLRSLNRYTPLQTSPSLCF
jgi:hypothetical protein